MAPKFKIATWIKDRLKESKSNSKKEPTMPYLPSRRPHPLTPTSSHESLTETQWPSQPPSCPLFAKLPGDIRRDILVLAFGNRILHMDLVFDHPPVPPPPEDQLRAMPKHRQPHAALDPAQMVRYANGPPPRTQRDKPRAWRWGGSVCHRNPPGEPTAWTLFSYGWTGLWYDYCQRGNADYCSSHEGRWPDKCAIGIVGFLLSCRQAYVEGIDVLYGANRISILSEPLLLRLPQLILPQRLASITSMELNIVARIDKSQLSRWEPDFSHLAPILGTLTTHCRGLRSLFLSLESNVYCSPDRLPALFQEIDAFFRSMRDAGLRNMSLALPKNASESCRESAVRPAAERALQKRQLLIPWRCFDGEEEGGGKGKAEARGPEMQIRLSGNWPKPPSQLPTLEDENKYVPSTGYWIVESNDDRPQYIIGCFGTTVQLNSVN